MQLMPLKPTEAMKTVLTNEKVVYQTAEDLYEALLLAYKDQITCIATTTIKE